MIFLPLSISTPRRGRPTCGGQVKLLGFRLGDPRAWTRPRRVELCVDEVKDGRTLYVGRGAKHMGLAPSRWGNPFRVSEDFSRAEACMHFEQYLKGDNQLYAQLGSLEGRLLACHCRLHHHCHADVLVRAFDDFRDSALFKFSQGPATACHALQVAEQRRTSLMDSLPQRLQGRISPTAVHGSGHPVWVWEGPYRRLLADGGGLCSPGLSPPEHRLYQTGPVDSIRHAVRSALAAIDADYTGGCGELLAKLIFWRDT